MSNKAKIIFWILFFAALFPVLFFPISTDLGEFLLGGKTISLGKKIFVDFIDIKPPFCYYVFAIFYSITGGSEIGIRVIDVIWQLITIFSIIFVMKKFLSEISAAYIIALIYCITYTTLQYYNTFQLETMLALPMIWIIYFTITADKLREYAYLGLIAGLVSGLKYSFGIIIIPILIYEFLLKDKNFIQKLKSSGKICLFAINGLFITSLPLFDREIRNEFINILFYVNNYNQRVFGNLLYESVRITAIQLIDKFSVSLLLMAILSLLYLKKEKIESFNKTSKLIIFNILLLLFFWISIIVEMKFFEYHFARLFLPLSILSGLGLIYLYRKIRDLWKQSGTIIKCSLILFLTLILYFSPLVKWTQLLRVPYYYFTDTAKYDVKYEIPENPIKFRVYQKQAAEYLKNNFRKSEKVFVMGIGSNIIYLLSGADNFSKYSMSSFYFYEGAPESWKKDIAHEVASSVWLVIAYNSSYPYFTRHNKTVIESIESNPILRKIIFEEFKLDYSNERYMIFRVKYSN